MKIVLLLAGLGLMAYPFVVDEQNMFAAIFFIIMGGVCLSALRDKPKLKYLGTRQTHIFGKKDK